MMKHVVIIGDSPMRKSLREQYVALGVEKITECGARTGDFSGTEDADEYVILSTSSEGDPVADDNAALDTLTALAKARSGTEHRRPVVHLSLQSQTSLWMLQTMDLPQEINDKLEVYPFTIEDVWAKNVLVQLPGIKNDHYPTLDRQGISRTDDCHVHVVVSGFDSQAEAVAIHAALTAHYPNYRPADARPLRTRITIIDEDISPRRDMFVARYRHLFGNSYYRTIHIGSHTVEFHRPVYEGRRTDFVDVEWEFVDAAVSNPEVSDRIAQWAHDKSRQLTFFISHDSDERNLSECVSLPGAIYAQGIPVMVRQSRKGLTEALSRSVNYRNIRPFGMLDCGYDVTLPLVHLAKLLNYFYFCSYGNEGTPTELPADKVDEVWHGVKSFRMRFSNIYNVMTIATKMRSLGHDADDAGTFYALTNDEIEALAETEHNRWSVERLIQGVRPCTDEETAEIRTDVKRLKKAYKNRDIHFDLRAYSDLEEDGTGKNAQVYDYDLIACIPLIVKSFYEERLHGG